METLCTCSIVLMANFKFFLRVSFHVVGPRSNVCTIFSPIQVTFQLLLQRLAIRTCSVSGVKNSHHHHRFCVFPRNCRVLGVHEERKEEKGKGREREGGRGEEGPVFLTFRMVTGRATAGSDRTSAWKVTCAHHGQISFTTSRQKSTLFC